MLTYKILLVPGPVSAPEALRAAYQIDYGSADIEEEFFDLYAECEAGLRTILGTQNQVTIQSGEGGISQKLLLEKELHSFMFGGHQLPEAENLAWIETPFIKDFIVDMAIL